MWSLDSKPGWFPKPSSLYSVTPGRAGPFEVGTAGQWLPGTQALGTGLEKGAGMEIPEQVWSHKTARSPLQRCLKGLASLHSLFLEVRFILFPWGSGFREVCPPSRAPSADSHPSLPSPCAGLWEGETRNCSLPPTCDGHGAAPWPSEAAGQWLHLCLGGW